MTKGLFLSRQPVSENYKDRANRGWRSRSGGLPSFSETRIIAHPLPVPFRRQIDRHYGGVTGLLKGSFHRLMAIGRRRGPPESFARVVFICTGNICRSPYAAARAADWGLQAASAGLAVRKDSSANRVAQTLAAERGVDLSTHRATPLAALDIQPGDWILCMEPAHRRQIKRALGVRTGVKIGLLGDWTEPRRPYIHDPYGLAVPYWRTCLDVIDSGIREIAALTRMNRDSKSILVPAAHSRGGIAVIRSLGRAGYRVHAAAAHPKALGLSSSFATARVVHPPVSSDALCSWLKDYVDKHGIDLIIPGGGIGPETCKPTVQLQTLFPTSSDPSVFAVSRSKYNLFSALEAGGPPYTDHLPPYRLVRLAEPFPPEAGFETMAGPYFVKLNAEHAYDDADDVIRQFATPTELSAGLKALQTKYDRALIQSYVPGRGVGVFLLRWDGKTKLRMMHERLHEMPHTGGASSLRKTVMLPEILADAERKLAYIGWQGVAMVEYRYDRATGQFWLMEMNLRFWGSLHLALQADVDFPLALADSFFGFPVFEQAPLRLGVRCRDTVPGEISYLVSLWRDPSVPLRLKARSLLEAGWLTLDPRVKEDLLFPKDRMLFWRRLHRLLRS